MKTLASHSRNHHEQGGNSRLVRLQNEKRKLETRITKLDSEISQLAPSRRITAAKLNRWLDELAEGLPDLPPLPADFSRGDLYEDHD